MAAKMNLAEATAELSKKSAEKSVIMEEIQKLEVGGLLDVCLDELC